MECQVQRARVQEHENLRFSLHRDKVSLNICVVFKGSLTFKEISEWIKKNVWFGESNMTKNHKQL